MKMNRHLACKYVLTEKELEKICGVLTQQVEKVAKDYTRSYSVDFVNGGQEDYVDLEEVLALENSGAWTIKEVALMFKSYHPDIYVRLNFSAHRMITISSIDFDVKGEDKEWVSYTVSRIEERLAKIKKFTPRLGALSLSTTFISLACGLMLGLFLPSSIKRAIDYIIYPSVSASLIIVGLILADFYIVPLHNFYWEDYIKRYDRSKSIRNFIAGSIIIALIIGIIGSIIATIITNSFHS